MKEQGLTDGESDRFLGNTTEGNLVSGLWFQDGPYNTATLWTRSKIVEVVNGTEGKRHCVCSITSSADVVSGNKISYDEVAAIMQRIFACNEIGLP